MDRSRRPKLLSDRFAIGSDAAAAWGNGKAAHGDPNAQILFFGSTKGAFAGFGLDGATIKWDESGDKALYGNPLTNTVIVNGGTPTPKSAEAFVSKRVKDQIDSENILLARSRANTQPMLTINSFHHLVGSFGLLLG